MKYRVEKAKADTQCSQRHMDRIGTVYWSGDDLNIACRELYDMNGRSYKECKCEATLKETQ